MPILLRESALIGFLMKRTPRSRGATPSATPFAAPFEGISDSCVQQHKERKTKRLRQLSGVIQKGLAQVLPQVLQWSTDLEMLDFTVQEVVMGHPSYCKVFISGPHEIEATQHLNRLVPRIRHELGQIVALRGVPNLHFQIDKTQHEKTAMATLLGKVQQDLRALGELPEELSEELPEDAHVDPSKNLPERTLLQKL